MRKRVKTTGVQAGILRKEADLDLAKLNLSYTVLTAHTMDMWAGTLELGQYVRRDKPSLIWYATRINGLLLIIKKHRLPISILVSKVRVKVDALPGEDF